jgi:hypothetical protein
LNGLTAWQSLDALDLPSGAMLLVRGAVGGFAVELAALRGLRVVAVAGAADEELVRGPGAEWFVTRDVPDLTAPGRPHSGAGRPAMVRRHPAERVAVFRLLRAPDVPRRDGGRLVMSHITAARVPLLPAPCHVPAGQKGATGWDVPWDGVIAKVPSRSAESGFRRRGPPARRSQPSGSDGQSALREGGIQT